MEAPTNWTWFLSLIESKLILSVRVKLLETKWGVLPLTGGVLMVKDV